MNLLISVRPRFVDMILSGSKTVEFRAHSANVCAGETIWIYTTRPRAEIGVRGLIEEVVVGKPAHIWKRYKQIAGISRKEYLEYVNGRECVTALVLRRLMVLHQPMPLEKVRALEPDFHPPQGIARADDSRKIIKALRRIPTSSIVQG